MTRIAIIDPDKCKPEKCSKECIKSCPPQKSGKQVIELIDIENIGLQFNSQTTKSNLNPMLNIDKLTNKKKIAKIAESLCIGCNQCVRTCPFEAIKIINLPEENPLDIVHRYSINGFRLYKLPILKPNCIIGIVGANGVGKTTLIDILSNQTRPNFENFSKTFTDKEIINKFRGTVLQDYLKDLYGNKLTFSIKEQKIKQKIPKKIITVKNFLKSKSIDLDIINPLPESYYFLEINKIIDLNLQTLSGGELQKLLCWITVLTPASVYIFDEPSNFLDVKQRLEISKLIRSINNQNKYTIVIEHDLSMLDYISDELYIVYGKAGAYGIVSKPLTSLEGINMYLSGYITTQNIRFRDEEFNFKSSSQITQITQTTLTQTSSNSNEKLLIDNDNKNKQIEKTNIFEYSSNIIKFTGYELSIPSGSIRLSNSIYVILGENGTGKSTFINWISKTIGCSVSVKEQSTEIKKFINQDNTYPSVLEFLHHKIKSSYFNPTFQTDIIKQLEIDQILTRKLDELSGGESQKVFIALCLGTPADIYLFDEPSANLDIEKRLKITKIIKKFIINNNKTAFIIEHDIMMSVAFGQEHDSKIILVKEDSYDFVNKIKKCSISEPLNFDKGINSFLQLMGITMRLSSNNRPRINKLNSQLDQEQKKTGKYYGAN